MMKTKRKRKNVNGTKHLPYINLFLIQLFLSKFREEIKKEIENVKREYHKNKLKKSKEDTEENKREVEKKETLEEYKNEYDKYKDLKKNLPKKGAGREEFTLNLLAKFKEKLNAVKEPEPSSSETRQIDEDDSW